MNKIKKLAFGVATTTLLCLILTGCGIGKPTVNLNDYVTVTSSGYDGYGSIYVSFDYEQIVKDYADKLSNKLDTQYFGNKTASIAAEYVFFYYKPYAVAYETSRNFCNGDTVDLSWNTNDDGIKMLKSVLNLNYTYKNFSYTVADLTELREVDPFENINIDYSGMDGEGTLYSLINTYIDIGNGNKIGYDLQADLGDNNAWSNGDTLHVSLEAEGEMLAERYGIKLTRKEADVELIGFPYYAYENPEEIIECLTEESLDNAMNAITDWMNDSEDRRIELVGALYYYQDENNAFSLRNNPHNQLVLIYHVENDVVPGGWYTYLAPNNDVMITYSEAEDGSLYKTTMLNTKSEFSTWYLYYSRDIGLFKQPYPTTFTYNGKTYTGHQTLEDCIYSCEANQKNSIGVYDHLIADSNLKEYVTER